MRSADRQLGDDPAPVQAGQAQGQGADPVLLDDDGTRLDNSVSRLLDPHPTHHGRPPRGRAPASGDCGPAAERGIHLG